MDELDDIAPNLGKLKKQHSFSVPEGYFEGLPHEIQAKANLQKSRNLFAFPTFLKYTTVGLAACLLIIFFWNPKNTDNSEQRAQVSLQDISQVDIEESLLVEELSTKPSKEVIVDSTTVEYLMDNDVELNVIIQEF